MVKDDNRFFRTAHPDRYAILKANSCSNRKTMTHEEMLLWEHLRNSKLGVKFRRQHAIGDYIADFACISLGLVIEVDGGYHDSTEQKKEDEIRTMQLNALGFEVIRFSNEDINCRIESVLELLKEKINSPL
ncbi:MAG: endonuclease domain-containing protein [Prevotellaceae bacterium]|nr:endonuclease domain-containing protein [Prevotellaceae bacterium]